MNEKWRKFLSKGRIVMAFLLALMAICGTWNWRSSAIFLESLGEAGVINLYGQVVDETGMPLAGVKVEFQVYKPNPFLVVGYERSGIGTKELVVTDANGRFAITRRWGHLLQFYQFDKVGYEDSKRAKKYPRHPADMRSSAVGASADNPVVFKLHAKTDAGK